MRQLHLIMAITLAGICGALGGHAETAYFRASTQEDMAPISASLRYAQGTPYVSLDNLARGLGGSVRLLPDRAQVNVAGITAVLAVNEVPVMLPGLSFSLIYPSLVHDDEIYVALADVADFFARAYEIQIVRVEREQPAPVLTPIDPDDTLFEETPHQLLDSVVSDSVDEEPPTPVAEAPEEGSLLSPLEEAVEEPVPEPAPPEEPVLAQAVEEPLVLPTTATIIIDPGHGGRDAGAVGAAGLAEKDISLETAIRLRRILKETTNLSIQLTREEDRDTSMGERTGRQGDLFISLHGGYAMASRASGMTLFVDNATQAADMSATEENADALGVRRKHAERASAFAYRMMQSLAQEEGSGAIALRGIPVLLQRDLDMPCILIEFVYLSNPQVEGLAAEEEFQESLAQALARAINAVFMSDTEE